MNQERTIQTKQERKQKSEDENGEWERGRSNEEKMREVKGSQEKSLRGVKRKSYDWLRGVGRGDSTSPPRPCPEVRLG